MINTERLGGAFSLASKFLHLPILEEKTYASLNTASPFLIPRCCQHKRRLCSKGKFGSEAIKEKYKGLDWWVITGSGTVLHVEGSDIMGHRKIFQANIC